MTDSLILDTHALIWVLEGKKTLNNKTVDLITEVSSTGNLIIPAISLWEIAMLSKKEKIKLNQPLDTWMKEVLSLPYMKLANLTPEISIESCNLPGDFHGDPADRMIVATSRIFDSPLVTRDRKILEYAKSSYLNVAEI